MSSTAKIQANQANALCSTGPKSRDGKAASSVNARRHGLRSSLPVLPGESKKAWEAHREATIAALNPMGYVETTLAERVALLIWRLDRVARFETSTVTAEIEDSEDDVGRSRYGERDGAPAHPEDIREAIIDAEACVGGYLLLRDAPDDALFPSDLASPVIAGAAKFAGVDASKLAFEGVEGPFENWARAVWTVGKVRRVVATVAAASKDVALQKAERVWRRFGDVADKKLNRLQSVLARVEFDVRRKQGECLLPSHNLYHDDLLIRYETHLERSLFRTIRELQRLQALRAGDARAVPMALDVDLAVAHHQTRSGDAIDATRNGGFAVTFGWLRLAKWAGGGFLAWYVALSFAVVRCGGGAPSNGGAPVGAESANCPAPLTGQYTVQRTVVASTCTGTLVGAIDTSTETFDPCAQSACNVHCVGTQQASAPPGAGSTGIVSGRTDWTYTGNGEWSVVFTAPPCSVTYRAMIQ